MAEQPDVALEHYRQRSELIQNTTDAASGQWSNVDPQDIAASWVAELPELVVTVAGAQMAAAEAAEAYVEAVLEAAAEGVIQARAFAGVASDGRTLAGLLWQPAVSSLLAIKHGAPLDRAMAAGRATLEMLVRTQVADAGRAADQAALVARKEVDGYVRIIVGATCSRCMILAGKFYRWSSGFDRHPNCDCVHLPVRRAKATGFIQDPHASYEKLSPRERQLAGWSLADQKAIAEGADLNQVTNARRGMYTAGGRKFTREGTSRSALFGGFDIDAETGKLTKRKPGAPRKARLTPDQIYAEAKDRDEAVQLLRENGYLFGKPAAKAEAPIDLQRRAIERQATIDKARARAEFLAELEEIVVINETDGPTIARMASVAAKRFGVVDDPELAKLLKRAEAGDAAMVEASLEALADRLGLTRIGGDLQTTQIVRYDKRLHNMLPGEKPTPWVEVVRPGYQFDLNGERLVLTKAVVAESDHQPMRILAAQARKPAEGAAALKAAPLSITDLDGDAFSLARQYKSQAYININGQLRRLGDKPIPRGFAYGFLRDVTNAIDPAMQRSRLTTDILTYKGIADGERVFGKAWGRSLVNAEWTEHGYDSTSALREIAEGFVKDDGALLILRVPKGIGAIRLSGTDYEAELLLQRKLRRRVISDTGPGPNRVIEVEVGPAREGLAKRAARTQPATKAQRVGSVPIINDAAVGPAMADSGVHVRPQLQNAKTRAELAGNFRAMARLLSPGSRIVDVDFKGLDLATAAEYAEGLLRCREFFPEVRLFDINTFQAGRGPRKGVYAEAGFGEISFNSYWGQTSKRAELLSALQKEAASGWSVRNSGNPMAVAIHEFGHLLDIDYLGKMAHDEITALIAQRATEAGITPGLLVQLQISEYAMTDTAELAAEAFMDVMVNGTNASSLSREIFDILLTKHKKKGS